MRTDWWLCFNKKSTRRSWKLSNLSHNSSQHAEVTIQWVNWNCLLLFALEITFRTTYTGHISKHFPIRKFSQPYERKIEATGRTLVGYLDGLTGYYHITLKSFTLQTDVTNAYYLSRHSWFDRNESMKVEEMWKKRLTVNHVIESIRNHHVQKESAAQHESVN